MKKLFIILETLLFLGWIFFIGQIAYNYHTCDVMPNNIQLFMMMAYSTGLILINNQSNDTKPD